MPEKIQDYQAFRFPSASEASETGARIMQFVGSPRGIGWMGGPLRAVIWTGSALGSDGTLYLRRGAVEAAKGAGIVLGQGEKISAAELPITRALLLGDASDWHPNRP